MKRLKRHHALALSPTLEKQNKNHFFSLSKNQNQPTKQKTQTQNAHPQKTYLHKSPQTITCILNITQGKGGGELCHQTDVLLAVTRQLTKLQYSTYRSKQMPNFFSLPACFQKRRYSHTCFQP